MSTAITETEHSTIIPKEPEKGRWNPIPVDRLLELALKGLTTREIGAIVGCDYTNVSKRLQPYKDRLIDLPTYRKNRADLWTGTERELLLSVSPQDIAKMPPAARITAAAICYDKTRLEEGKSLDNSISLTFNVKMPVPDEAIDITPDNNDE